MYLYGCRVVRVIDGDTFVADVDLGFRLWQRAATFRLAGVDAFELRDPKGPAAKQFLQDLVDRSGGSAQVRTHKPDPRDKYGRWLADLLIHNGSVADLLLEAGLARKVMP
jgi:endonuclease YncB( thermonuclease family)